jgi:uncharacterized protein YceH (UPF0502 family)
MDETNGPKVVVYDDGAPEPSPVSLDEREVRVLGALVEKQVTTPDYYPLTLNALVNACNQTSSREPVVIYDESTVTRAIDGLRDQKLASVSGGAESRVAKFRHKLSERFELDGAQLAVLCLLMLRGPQTPGEIRTRSGRLHEFASVEETESTLEQLSNRLPQPLVLRLPRAAGRKEARFTHLLSGIPSAIPNSPAASESPTATAVSVPEELAMLRQELNELRAEFAEFRKQFE